MEDMKLNELLRRLRETLHITQAELAKKIGVSRQQLVNWELGLAYPSDKHFEVWKKVLCDGLMDTAVFRSRKRMKYE